MGLHAKRLSIALLIALLLGPRTASAQQPTPDRSALQAVALFEHACLRFAGKANDLQAWAMSLHLPEAAGDQAAAFLGGHGGKVFGASTPDGKMALVSRDTGSCEIVMPFGNKVAIDQSLLAEFTRHGAAITNVVSKDAADRGVHQTMMDVHLGIRDWKVSTTSHAHNDVPNGLPEIILIATSK